MSSADDDVLERFSRIPTSTICDAYVRSGSRRPETMFIGGTSPLHSRSTHVVGRARTQRMGIVRDRERSAIVADRELSFSLVDGARAGDFLVIAAPEGAPSAVFGGTLALMATKKGAVAAVVDGYTRDCHEILELGLPVWAGGVTAIAGGYAGYSVVEVGVPVVCRGVEVFPDDYLIGDGDGVVVVPASAAAELLELCELMDADEVRAHAAIDAGRSMIDSYVSRDYYKKAD